MGLIGIKIRIATKEKLVPEFKLKTLSEISTKITKQEDKDEHVAET